MNNNFTSSSAASSSSAAAVRNNGNECLQYILVNEGDVDITPVLSKTPIATTVTSHSKSSVKNHHNKQKQQQNSALLDHHQLHQSSIGSNQNLAPPTSIMSNTAASTSTQPSILKPKPNQLQDSRNSQSSFDLSNYSFVSLMNSPNNKPTPNGSIRRLSTKDVRNGKGLRHFAMKVCEKVKQKSVTTYNIVADELVSEITAEALASKTAFGESFDQKNIRRRVYDALNVLMAMNIISKDKKEIRWHGLPTNAVQECYELEREKEERLKRIEVKKKQLRELLIQHIAFKNLVERNKQFVQTPSRNAIITLPFIIVNTNKDTVIDCSISNDKSEYLFNFDNTFEIHDDIEVLKKMGLAANLDKEQLIQLDREELDKARRSLPEALRSELDQMIEEKQSGDF